MRPKRTTNDTEERKQQANVVYFCCLMEDINSSINSLNSILAKSHTHQQQKNKRKSKRKLLFSIWNTIFFGLLHRNREGSIESHINRETHVRHHFFLFYTKTSNSWLSFSIRIVLCILHSIGCTTYIADRIHSLSLRFMNWNVCVSRRQRLVKAAVPNKWRKTNRKIVYFGVMSIC